MAWLGKVSLGGFPDLAGAVTKLSESVKNIEKNFDSALGLEDKTDAGSSEGAGTWASSSDTIGLFEPVRVFMGHKSDASSTEASVKEESSEENRGHLNEQSPKAATDLTSQPGEEAEKVRIKDEAVDDSPIATVMHSEHQSLDRVGNSNEDNNLQADAELSISGTVTGADSVSVADRKSDAVGEDNEESQGNDAQPRKSVDAEQDMDKVTSLPDEPHGAVAMLENHDKVEPLHDTNNIHSESSVLVDNGQLDHKSETSIAIPVDSNKDDYSNDTNLVNSMNSMVTEHDEAAATEAISHDSHASGKMTDVPSPAMSSESDKRSLSVVTERGSDDSNQAFLELEKVKREMKMMEAALQGAAKQAQAKADEIAKLMNENEQLKSTVEDLKRKSSEAEIDSLREEYHQRVSSLERKVYALTKERDTLRREQSKKSDAAALLKEKDEIISQVMAEGEELSKRQATQEATIRKLRAQIREFEEEKQRLNSKLQVEESKVESLKRDKAATEKLLQETIEKNQAELVAQKEFYTNALNEAKEAEALAEARVNNEARTELERRLKEAGEREAMLVQTLEELRQTLSRTEQQAAFKEEMLRRDIDELQKRYQGSELRYTELITQVPESTRPLLRQIEAMQETAARRAEAWAGVERALNSRLQEAEAKAAAAEENERSLNDRLSQSLSRITILETQISCIRTEQAQLSRLLEKERQRASESKQEYLAAVEEAATQEGRAKQLEDEIKDLRIKLKKELQEEAARRELLEKELERERTARAELEKTLSRETRVVASEDPKNLPIKKLSNALSLSSIEESNFLQASLDSSDSLFSERRKSSEASMSPYFLKSMTPSSFEAALRQKDGELASYLSRLASLESIRDSLAEELVKMTEQCEKLRSEANLLPGLRAELESLRRRHSSALELMGERDEELEELRADIIDLKEMYREQVDLLVNKIQMLGSTADI